MLIAFSTGEKHELDFFMMNLDEEYSVVLGYNGLTWHNLVIVWTETKITFWHPPKPINPLKPSELRGVDIHFISAWALNKLCWCPENITFRISINESPNNTKETMEPFNSIPAQEVDVSPIVT